MYILETESKALYTAQAKGRYEAALAEVALYAPQAALTFGTEIAAGSGLAANQYQQNIAVNPLNQKQICISCKSPDDHAVAVLNSQDGGATWASTTFGASSDPTIAFDPFGNVFLITINNTATFDTFVRKSTDGGATWGSPAAFGIPIDHPSLTVDMNIGSPFYGSVYIFGEDRGHASNQYCIYSRDHGATWTTTTLASTGYTAQGFGNLSTGATYGPIALSDGTLLCPAFPQPGPTLSIGGHFATCAENWIIRSTNGGVTLVPLDLGTVFSPPTTFTANGNGNAYLAISNIAFGPNGSGGTRCYVCYSQSYSKQESQLMLQTSDDGGATWAPPRCISFQAASGAGSMWIGVNKAGVVGIQFYSLTETSTFTVNFIASLDNGATWSAPVAIPSAVSSSVLGSQPRAPGADEVYGCVGPDDKFYCTWSDARSPATVYTTYMRTVAVAAQYG